VVRPGNFVLMGPAVGLDVGDVECPVVGFEPLPNFPFADRVAVVDPSSLPNSEPTTPDFQIKRPTVTTSSRAINRRNP